MKYSANLQKLSLLGCSIHSLKATASTCTQLTGERSFCCCDTFEDLILLGCDVGDFIQLTEHCKHIQKLFISSTQKLTEQELMTLSK